ncbi:MAG: RnfABCDGE type electron transport complex subunit B [Endozoicomonadaceae bacterium]|nr:RnfABCDGE type electron transport complex subunit B [Endozoicomonadaceae bacterium]MBE8232526.1 RnfABCDGE type electron transport complex subunit B [Endozoicomonadaceae bacterium]
MKKEYLIDIKRIDAVLPQTQCQQCGYHGCLPYAEAIVLKNESIQLCRPGGKPVMETLSQLLNQPMTANADRQPADIPHRVEIREEDCIGCTKCIQACPMDAIVGAVKQMHTVIASSCTGCDLCIAPCPTDCIDIIPLMPNMPQVKPVSLQYAENRTHYTQRVARHNRAVAPKQIVKKKSTMMVVTQNKQSNAMLVQQAMHHRYQKLNQLFLHERDPDKKADYKEQLINLYGKLEKKEPPKTHNMLQSGLQSTIQLALYRQSLKKLLQQKTDQESNLKRETMIQQLQDKIAQLMHEKSTDQHEPL